MPAALRKKCQRCGKTKRLNEFYENSTKADHRNGICKACQKKLTDNKKGL